MLAALCGWSVPGGAQSSIEYELKATFLYKFVAFVGWPAPVLAAPVVRICVVGDDPFGPELNRAVAGQHIGEKPIEVMRLRLASEGAACHVMYLAGSQAESVDAAMAAVRGLPILTVTDSSHSPGDRGIIHFVIRQNRLRFEVDDQKAAENRLNLSSKLLSLATTVKPRT